jgi:rhodanese-related sulfurtransferase
VGHGDEEGIAFIGVDEARRLQESPRVVLMVDVRSAEEFQETRIKGAMNVPLTEIERRYAEIPRQGLVVLY